MQKKLYTIILIALVGIHTISLPAAEKSRGESVFFQLHPPLLESRPLKRSRFAPKKMPFARNTSQKKKDAKKAPCPQTNPSNDELRFTFSAADQAARTPTKRWMRDYTKALKDGSFFRNPRVAQRLGLPGVPSRDNHVAIPLKLPEDKFSISSGQPKPLESQWLRPQVLHPAYARRLARP